MAVILVVSWQSGGVRPAITRLVLGSGQTGNYPETGFGEGGTPLQAKTAELALTKASPLLVSLYIDFFRFLPSSFFSTLMPLSTCFSSSRKGGRKRRTVS